MTVTSIKIIDMKPTDYSKDFPFCPLMPYDPIIKMLDSEFAAQQFNINTKVRVITD